jgi:TatA/E family protein of Tat protein translocase
MPNIGAPELIIILVIALLILGPGKLPEVGASLGKSLREFRKASTDIQDAVKVDVDTTPLPPAAPAAPAAAVAAAMDAAPAAVAPGPAAVAPAPAADPPPVAPSAPSSDSSTVAS